MPHPASDRSRTIHAAWRAIRQPATAASLRTALPTPPVLSLRGRYEHVHDGPATRFPATAYAVPWPVWQRQMEYLDAGDAALRRNDLPAAERAFRALRDTHRDGDHPAPLIEARIGLADVARQRDDLDAAIDGYRQAIEEAEAAGYRFAANRARIAAGYLMMSSGPSGVAREQFARALEVARSRGWQLEVANALTGIGEAHQRLREPLPAMRALLEAATVFDRIGSVEGLANVTVQLGEVCRRERWVPDALGWYRQAVAAAAANGLVLAHVNALDGLAEIELEVGEHDAAARHHQEAYDAAGEDYPRGRAHALHGLARCAFAAEDYAGAAQNYARARDVYRQIGAPVSEAAAHAGLARCAELANDWPTAVEHRLAAVTCIERMRAAQLADLHQVEYFRRFGSYHARAIRTAVDAGDVGAFIAVAESIAGRRLAGLIESAPTDPHDAQLLHQLLLAADARARHDPPASEPRERRRARAVGRLALRQALPEMAAAAFDDVVAGLYAPLEPSVALPLLNGLGLTDEHLLVLTLLDDREPTELAWLLIAPTGPAHLGLHPVPAATVRLVVDLHRRGLSPHARPADLAALGDLLPAELRTLLPTSGRLLIIPAGHLWGVPWLAVPTPGGRFLGELAPLAVSPSLTALAHVRAPASSWRPPRTVATWRSPAVHTHELWAYDGSKSPTVVSLSDAAAARTAVVHSSHDLVVVVAHGRPRAELVHVLELDEQVALTPADLLTARVPPVLVLISCWGAHAPRPETSDPLTLATLALARGARSIAATVSELRDDAGATGFVNLVLHKAKTTPLPEALHQAVRQWLAVPGRRTDVLARWAPLIALGT